MKKYITSGTLYKVYYQPCALEFYFDWRPGIKDLRQLAYLEDLGSIDDFNKDEFEITKINTESCYDYGHKLRIK